MWLAFGLMLIFTFIFATIVVAKFSAGFSRARGGVAGGDGTVVGDDEFYDYGTRNSELEDKGVPKGNYGCKIIYLYVDETNKRTKVS